MSLLSRKRFAAAIAYAFSLTAFISFCAVPAAAYMCVTQAECPTCVGVPVECPAMYFICKYNTFASDYNFLELSSNAAADVRVTVQFYNNAGAPLHSAVTHTLPAFSRRDIDVHSVVGANTYGQIVVGVYGRALPEVLTAAVSHYKSSGFLQTANTACAFRTRSGLNTD